MKINNIIIVPYGTYSDGKGNYYIAGNKIAENAEAYSIEDMELLKVLNLNIPNSYSVETERLVDSLGNSYECIEEYLQLEYNFLNDVDSNCNVLVIYNKEIR